VVGSMQKRMYEQYGVKKYATDIVAEEVEFLTPKSESGNSEKPKREKTTVAKMSDYDDTDNLPF
ncbi:MAG: hypothetical protein RRZ69_06475, partial [Clostridia bacterium]